MKINSILLYNFGSYEGENLFDTRSTADDKNIVLIGGKNGAGKTTLFTAMRVCLYGYMSMGYKNINAHYNRAIIKLINNAAKLRRPAKAHVEMQIGLSNGHEVDVYTLRRAWTLGETLSEKFSVKKNAIVLSEDAVADFEKYLLTLIPPELFNLYFFIWLARYCRFQFLPAALGYPVKSVNGRTGTRINPAIQGFVSPSRVFFPNRLRITI